MFAYSQATGKLQHDGVVIGLGYSGNSSGLNNPEAQDLEDVGPIPQGSYVIAPPHADEKLGPVAMRLDPAHANQMFGRGDFLIHGDNEQMNYSASKGCIILPHAVRTVIAEYVLRGDTELTVTE